MAADPKDKQRVTTPLAQDEDCTEDSTLWLVAQEQVLAKVWNNEEDAEYGN